MAEPDFREQTSDSPGDVPRESTTIQAASLYPTNSASLAAFKSNLRDAEAKSCSRASNVVDALFDRGNDFRITNDPANKNIATEVTSNRQLAAAILDVAASEGKGSGDHSETSEHQERENQSSGKPGPRKGSSDIQPVAAKDQSDQIRKTDSGEEIRAAKVEVDKDGKVTFVVMNDGSQTSYSYKNGELAGKVTCKNGKLVAIESADGAGTNLQYDQEGKLIARVSTDKNGKIISQSAVNGDSTIEMRDKAGEIFGKARIDRDGKPLSWENNQTGSTINYRYNDKGELTEKVTTDKTGKLTDIVSADGTRTHFKYDKDGKLTEKNTFNRDGKFKSRENADGSASTIDYDGNGKYARTNYIDREGKLLVRNESDGSQINYRYDDSGKIQQQITTDKLGKIISEKIEPISADVEEQLRGDLKKRGQLLTDLKVVERIGMNGVSSDFNNVNINEMWEIAKKLPGDSQKTIENAINSSLPKGAKYNVTTEAPASLSSFMKHAARNSELQLYTRDRATGNYTGACLGINKRTK